MWFKMLPPILQIQCSDNALFVKYVAWCFPNVVEQPHNSRCSNSAPVQNFHSCNHCSSSAVFSGSASTHDTSSIFSHAHLISSVPSPNDLKKSAVFKAKSSWRTSVSAGAVSSSLFNHSGRLIFSALSPKQLTSVPKNRSHGCTSGCARLNTQSPLRLPSSATTFEICFASVSTGTQSTAATRVGSAPSALDVLQTANNHPCTGDCPPEAELGPPIWPVRMIVTSIPHCLCAILQDTFGNTFDSP
jgi:hypothetical protein